MLSLNQIRDRALAFAKDWRDVTSERASDYEACMYDARYAWSRVCMSSIK